MSAKNILLISHNFSPEPIGVGKYNGEMIDWLVNKGYNCTVITTFPYYPHWKVQAPYTNRWYRKETFKSDHGGSLTIYRCPSYIPAKPTGVLRTMQDFSYWVSKFFAVAKVLLARQKFDLIITIAPPFHLAYLGIMLRNLKGGKLLYHIQDLQIEAARDLKLFSNNTILKVLFKLERSILHSADYVSSISDGMIKRIKTKVDREITYFPNWVDTEFFKPLPNRTELKEQWGFNQTDTVFLYSGAIGVKQGLDCVLDAAEALQAEPGINFLICSSGPYKDELAADAERRNLTNVKFLPLQPREKFNDLLNMADAHLVMQKANAGDLVMPSKLGAILAVGGACIVTADQGTSLSNLVSEHNFGYVIKPGRADLLIDTITKIHKDNDSEIDKKRFNARDYAIKHLNIENRMEDFVEKFLE